MSIHYEGLKDLLDLTSKEVKRVFPFIEGAVASETQLLGNRLFPRDTAASLEVRFQEHFKTHVAATYRGRYQAGRRLITPEKFRNIGGTLVHKGNTRGLDPRTLDWLTLGSLDMTERWAKYFGDVQSHVVDLVTAIYTLNEIENWSAITLGSLTTDDGMVLDLPYIDFDNTLYDQGICYHTNDVWFTAGGDPITTADIMGDIEGNKLAMTNRGAQKPVQMMMNSTTFKAFIHNTELNEKEIAWHNPLLWMYYYDRDITDGFTPFGLRINIYDDFYYARSGDGYVPVKYIPDYYVVYAPARIGTRWVGPNDKLFDGKPRMYADTKEAQDKNNIEIEVGEASLPLPDDYRSIHVSYVKDLGGEA